MSVLLLYLQPLNLTMSSKIKPASLRHALQTPAPLSSPILTAASESHVPLLPLPPRPAVHALSRAHAQAVPFIEHSLVPQVWQLPLSFLNISRSSCFCGSHPSALLSSVTYSRKLSLSGIRPDSQRTFECFLHGSCHLLCNFASTGLNTLTRRSLPWAVWVMLAFF